MQEVNSAAISDTRSILPAGTGTALKGRRIQAHTCTGCIRWMGLKRVNGANHVACRLFKVSGAGIRNDPLWSVREYRPG